MARGRMSPTAMPRAHSPPPTSAHRKGASARARWVLVALGLLLLGPLLLGLLLAGGCAPAPAHPSVVLIVVDTLRANRLGCYGYPGPSSPELDLLAAEGVRFARVVAQNTWTRPSHGSMLTSLPPRTLGLYQEEQDALAPGFTTLAEVFRANGYATIGATANPNINAWFGFDQGFDRYVDSEIVFDFMSPLEGETVRAPGVRMPSAARLFETVEAELDRRPGPYYLQLNLMEVHEARELVELDRDAGLFPLEPIERRRYVQAVRHVSREIDRFARSLAARPAFADALFAITSDHGTHFEGEHAHVGPPKTHGFLVYESQALVPWILWSPGGGLPRGMLVERPVQLLDLMPTLLALAGIEGPAEMEGTSLAPLLADPGARLAQPELFVVETRFRGARKLAAYAGDWKLCLNDDGHEGLPPVELQGPGDEDGSASDRGPGEPETLARLVELLGRWRSAHPEAPSSPAAGAKPEALERGLQSLGYGR